MSAPVKPFAIGLDIGGTRTKLGIVDSTGRIFQATEFKTNADVSSSSDFIAKLLEEIDTMLTWDRKNIKGIGLCFLGWLNDAKNGPQFCMNAPALHQLNFLSLLEDAFHLPVVVHDDVTAHTLAEYHFGGGRGSRRFLCLAMGTGVGAGIVINGKALDFTGGCAGDTGHIILRPGGPACTSGCRGCGEALIGVAGIERLAAEKYADKRQANELIRAANTMSDSVAVNVMREIGSYIGELLASLFRSFCQNK